MVSGLCLLVWFVFLFGLNVLVVVFGVVCDVACSVMMLVVLVDLDLCTCWVDLFD